eukprot:768567-Hanusia_phi.AAC.3
MASSRCQMPQLQPPILLLPPPPHPPLPHPLPSLPSLPSPLPPSSIPRLPDPLPDRPARRDFSGGGATQEGQRGATGAAGGSAGHEAGSGGGGTSRPGGGAGEGPGADADPAERAEGGGAETLREDAVCARTGPFRLTPPPTPHAIPQGSESGLAKDLNELLSMKLEKSTFDAALREAREDAAAAHQAIEDANVIHEQQLAMVHAAAAKREGELEGEKEELQKEVERLMKSLEDKSSELAAAEERANKAENQLALLRSKVASMEGELKREQQRRRDEIDEINRSKELAIEELEARQRELTDSVEEVKEEEGGGGRRRREER